MSDQSPPPPPRRFIAGAVCPSCRAVDRLLLETHGPVNRRRCVACGFSDELETGVAPGALPADRMARARSTPTEARPIRILDDRREDSD